MWQNTIFRGNLRINRAQVVTVKCVTLTLTVESLTAVTDRETIRRSVVRHQTRQILMQSYASILEPRSR